MLVAITWVLFTLVASGSAFIPREESSQPPRSICLGTMTKLK